ncbi:MAG: ribonuclease H family protein [Acholeplasmatales bacterium]|nr:ribonuclease H family protein [Acholeplasmatales bacterium]
MKFYAVKGDNYSNIFTSWDEAKKAIATICNPKYKSFASENDAKDFLDGKNILNEIKEPVCYIDGSYDEKTNAYSFGGILLYNGKEYEFKRRFESDEYSLHRNVSGEIRGASYIINYSLKRGIKKLHLFYDYIGIEKWYKGEWKANTNIAIKYVNFAKEVDGKIEVVFHKVKSHTNDKYNDIADRLAKEALDLA